MAAAIALLYVITGILGTIIFIATLEFFFSIRPFKRSSDLTPDDFNMQYKEVSFKTSDDLLLKGWWIPKRGAKSTIITSPGYHNDKKITLRHILFLHKKYNILVFDHRYFGESEGLITTGGLREVRDVKAAVAFVKAKKEKNHPIAIYGFSMSASATLMAQPKVNAIVADSPYANLLSPVRHLFSHFSPLQGAFVKVMDVFCKVFFGIRYKDISPENAVKYMKIPILLIHGNTDSVTPIENANMIKNANPKYITLWIVPKAGHCKAHEIFREKYEYKVMTFLKKHLR